MDIPSPVRESASYGNRAGGTQGCFFFAARLSLGVRGEPRFARLRTWCAWRILQAEVPPSNAKTRVKLIIAIIQPTKLDPLRESLVKIGVTRMTVCDAQGYGQQRGRTAMYRGHEYKTNLLRKIALEIMVNDDFVDRTLSAITSVARTGPEGSIGDGKVFVVPAERVVRIDDELEGPEAV